MSKNLQQKFYDYASKNYVFTPNSKKIILSGAGLIVGALVFSYLYKPKKK